MKQNTLLHGRLPTNVSHPYRFFDLLSVLRQTGIGLYVPSVVFLHGALMLLLS